MKSICSRPSGSSIACFLIAAVCFIAAFPSPMAVNTATWNGGNGFFFSDDWTITGNTSYTIGTANTDLGVIGNVASGTQTVEVNSSGSIGNYYLTQTSA